MMRVWFAAPHDKVKTIIEHGFGKPDDSEEGLYGKGLYFSTSAKYSFPQFVSLRNFNY